MKTAILQRLHQSIGLVAVMIASLTLLIALPIAHTAALTANQQTVCDSIGSGPDCAANTNGGSDVNNVITTIINLLSGVVGVVAVIMIVVAGFKYITSSGDSTKLTSAKNTLLYALIGLVIVALAQAIVRFVLVKTV
jgi:type IV secretory pathway VirB2 component (pilin)